MKKIVVSLIIILAVVTGTWGQSATPLESQPTEKFPPQGICPQGPAGPQGPQGETGPTGAPGRNGRTVIIHRTRIVHDKFAHKGVYQHMTSWGLASESFVEARDNQVLQWVTNHFVAKTPSAGTPATTVPTGDKTAEKPEGKGMNDLYTKVFGGWFGAILLIALLTVIIGLGIVLWIHYVGRNHELDDRRRGIVPGGGNNGNPPVMQDLAYIAEIRAATGVPNPRDDGYGDFTIYHRLPNGGFFRQNGGHGDRLIQQGRTVIVPAGPPPITVAATPATQPAAPQQQPQRVIIEVQHRHERVEPANAPAANEGRRGRGGGNNPQPQNPPNAAPPAPGGGQQPQQRQIGFRQPGMARRNPINF